MSPHAPHCPLATVVVVLFIVCAFWEWLLWFVWCVCPPAISKRPIRGKALEIGRARSPRAGGIPAPGLDDERHTWHHMTIMAGWPLWLENGQPKVHCVQVSVPDLGRLVCDDRPGRYVEHLGVNARQRPPSGDVV